MTKPAISLGLAVLEEFRKLQPTMPLVRARVFLTVAQRPGITMTNLAKSLDVSQAAISRHVSVLGTAGRFIPGAKRREKGLDLVQAIEDPVNHQQKKVWLRPKGERLRERIARAEARIHS